MMMYLPKMHITAASIIPISGARQMAWQEGGAQALTYVGGRPQSRLVWVDRAGDVEPFDERTDIAFVPRLSPDETRLATGVIEQGGRV